MQHNATANMTSQNMTPISHNPESCWLAVTTKKARYLKNKKTPQHQWWQQLLQYVLDQQGLDDVRNHTPGCIAT